MYRERPATPFYRITAHGVHAFDAQTGSALWAWNTGFDITVNDTQPSGQVRDGIVYFCGQVHDRTASRLRRVIVAIEGDSGQTKWIFFVEQAMHTTNQILMLVVGETIVLTSCAPASSTCAISLHTGELLWNHAEPFGDYPCLAAEGTTLYFDRT
jgi:outer membrane protein assembly factor BamB